jgi:ubiquitin conjugation factor E4 B
VLILWQFITLHFVDRIAQMLDYYLVVLTGPEVLEINVENPGKYNFIPRKLLGQIIETFVALAQDKTFCDGL